jgi:hypothetical protein
MHPLLRPVLGRKYPSVEYLGITENATDLTTYTTGTVSLGDPNRPRMIVLGVTGEDSAVSFTAVAASCTITPTGGSAITVLTGAASLTSGLLAHATLLYAKVPHGATGDITIVWDEAITSCKIARWAVYDLESYIRRDFVNSLGDSAGADLTTTACQVDANGVIFAVAACNVATSVTWTGIDESYDTSTNEHTGSGGYRIYKSGHAAPTITADFAAGDDNALAVCAFR